MTLRPIDIDEVGPATFYSDTPRPWFLVRSEDALPVGRWISITYSASLYDELVRPLLRFETPDGVRLDLLPAPLFGRGTWIGYVPLDATEICISPVERPGYFGFRLDAFAVLPSGWPTCLALLQNPRLGALAILAACRRQRGLARELICAAIRSCPFGSYDSWHAHRTRAAEPDGLERPRRDGHDGPHIRVIVHANEGTFDTSLAATLASLCQQLYPNWSLAVVACSERLLTMVNEMMARVGRQGVHILPVTPIRARFGQTCRRRCCWRLVAGGTMLRTAGLLFRQYSSSHPQRDVIYADEDHVDRRGRLNTPVQA